MAIGLIWGAGGHGKVAAATARAAGWRLVGFVDRDRSKLGTLVDGIDRVLLAEEDLSAGFERARRELGFDGVLVAIGDNRRRLELTASIPLDLRGTIAHPTALVVGRAHVGRGTLMCAGSIVHPDAAIGVAVIINTGAIVEHDCRVGDGAHVAPAAVLGGGVSVGTRTLVGAGAVVLPGVTIGDDAVVGAGAVVHRDVASGVTVVGSPARPLGGAR